MTHSFEPRLGHKELGAYSPPSRRAMGWLAWVVVISLSMNLFVIAFIALQVRDGSLWFEVESPSATANLGPSLPSSESLTAEVIQLTAKEDDELVRALDDERLVANGYRVQELALAILRSRGYQVDDPLRPLGAWPQPMSSFSWTAPDGKKASLMLFSGLGEREVQAVKAYLQEAAVPLTAEGIVRRLASGQAVEPMRAALVRTDEWAVFSKLFSPLPEEELFSLCQEMGAEGFLTAVQWGRGRGENDGIGPFLVSLVAKFPSPKLADWVALHYADAIVVGAPDEAILAMYSSLPPRSEAGVRLAMRILHGQRKLPVWQASQAYLARAASMPTLSSMSRDQALESLQSLVRPSKVVSAPKISPPPLAQKPAAEVASQPKIVPQPSKPLSAAGQASVRAANRQLQLYRTYTVKKGDTLWSIAKKFNVDVEKLKYLNGLRGASLSPGRTLRIPH